jgi:hypothetical protein
MSQASVYKALKLSLNFTYNQQPGLILWGLEGRSVHLTILLHLTTRIFAFTFPYAHAHTAWCLNSGDIFIGSLLFVYSVL